MTDEQKNYIEAMKLWFKNEENQNAIDLNNLENAKMMVRLYSIEAKNKQELLDFNLKRKEEAKILFDKWLTEN